MIEAMAAAAPSFLLFWVLTMLENRRLRACADQRDADADFWRGEAKKALELAEKWQRIAMDLEAVER